MVLANMFGGRLFNQVSILNGARMCSFRLPGSFLREIGAGGEFETC